MHDACPVCASPFTAYVRDVPTIRTKRQIKLFACLDCRSFWNPSGYREDDRVLQLDMRWGLSVEERNKQAANKLFDNLEKMGVRFSSVAEIGCGIGTLLRVAEDRGKKAVGFDVNKHAIKHAVEQNNVDALAEMWTADTETIPIDLYLNISVLEHLDAPRPLIEDLCKAATRNRATLFISVPFVGRNKWNFILDPDPQKEGTPFIDNDVHVTHFSVEGLMKAMREFGQENLTFVQSWLWQGVCAMPQAPLA